MCAQSRRPKEDKAFSFYIQRVKTVVLTPGLTQRLSLIWICKTITEIKEQYYGENSAGEEN